jgi:hypothetical protein
MPHSRSAARSRAARRAVTPSMFVLTDSGLSPSRSCSAMSVVRSRSDRVSEPIIGSGTSAACAAMKARNARGHPRGQSIPTRPCWTATSRHNASFARQSPSWPRAPQRAARRTSPRPQHPSCWAGPPDPPLLSASAQPCQVSAGPGSRWTSSSRASADPSSRLARIAGQRRPDHRSGNGTSSGVARSGYFAPPTVGRAASPGTANAS